MESFTPKLPLSYRFSQMSVLVSLAALASTAWGVLSILPQFVQVTSVAFAGLVLGSSLLVTSYVLVRYPFLSLVASELPGDRFAGQYGTRIRLPVLVLKVLSLAFCVMGLVLTLRRGIDSITETVFVCYAITMIPVLVFLIFVYEPTSHPTIATLVRSTFGIGIVFFPLYIPVLAIGSLRCSHILRRSYN